MMSIFLKDIQPGYGSPALCYIVEVVIATSSPEDHVCWLLELFAAIQKARLMLNPEKSKI